MTMTDPIADMLTRIRNGNVAMHDEVVMPSSKLKEALAALLEREGYIAGFRVEGDTGHPGRKLIVMMKYTPERKRTITGIKRVSKPGLRGLQQGRQRRPGPRRHGCRHPFDQPGSPHRP